MKKFVLFAIIWLILLLAPGETQPVSAQGPSRDGAVVGKPWRGAPGIRETVAQIMERERRAPKAAFRPRAIQPRRTTRNLPRRHSPSPKLPSPVSPQALALGKLPAAPQSPQPVGTSFLGAQISDTIGFIPPDSMGAVGPTQILVVVNGRIRVFDKSGVVGSLNATLDNFFGSLSPGTWVTGDPNVRYDRLSGRWFVTALNFTSPNRLFIAVSSGATITDTSSFTFFQFQHDLVGPTPNADTGLDADYDSLGVDKNSLYIGIDVFGSSLSGTTGFVVNKSDLLAGTLTVTAFRQLVSCSLTCGSGPLQPRGVHNDDPAATEGYFVGVDGESFGLLALRRITYTLGITPTISSNITMTVPPTAYPIDVPALGSTFALDAIDDRLFNAQINKNKITGATSLWTAHNIQVDSTGSACDPNYGVPCTNGGRDAARWYELGNLTTTPTLLQSGTLFDSAATNPRFFWIPSVAMSGQGHMALASSTAVSATTYAGIAVAGRFSGDAAGTLQPFTLAQDGLGSYNLVDQFGRNRWGDYSQTVVDPNDDMTMWTFQEYANATDSWGVRVIQLIAPPPATITTLNPPSLPQGQYSASVIVTGTSSSGSGFFDPGSDTGGPGYANHLGASVSGRVVVNSIAFNSPTQVILNLNTVCANVGAQTITITNPDGQNIVGAGVLTITSAANSCVTLYFPLIFR